MLQRIEVVLLEHMGTDSSGLSLVDECNLHTLLTERFSKQVDVFPVKKMSASFVLEI